MVLPADKFQIRNSQLLSRRDDNEVSEIIDRRTFALLYASDFSSTEMARVVTSSLLSREWGVQRHLMTDRQGGC